MTTMLVSVDNTLSDPSGKFVLNGDQLELGPGQTLDPGAYGIEIFSVRSYRVEATLRVPFTYLHEIQIGQSLREYPNKRGTPRVIETYAETLRGLMGFSKATDFTVYNSGWFTHDGSGEEANDWTFRTLNAASGGASMVSSFGGQTAVGNSFGDTGNYYLNSPGVDASGDTGNADDDNSQGAGFTAGPLWREVRAAVNDAMASGRPFNLARWSIGTTNMTDNPEDLAEFKAAVQWAIADLRSRVGNPYLPIYLNQIGRHQTAASAGAEGIREVYRQIAEEDAYFLVAAEEYPYRMAITANRTASLTEGSAVVSMADTSGFSVNRGVYHPDLPGGTYVSAVDTNVSITLARRTGTGTEPVLSPVTANDTTVSVLDNVHLHPGSDGLEASQPDKGFYALEKAAARFIHSHLKAANRLQTGPYISGAQIEQGTDSLLVEFTHGAGVDLTVADFTGWTVFFDGVSVDVVDVEKVSGHQLRLSLEEVLGSGVAGVSVQYAYGAMNRADYTKFLVDDAGFPVQSRRAVTAAIEESTAELILSATDSGINTNSASSYALSGLAIGDAPDAGQRRFVVVGIAAAAGSTTRSVQSVTVGGIAATALVGADNSQNNAGDTSASYSDFYMAEVPTGATAEVVVAWNSTLARCGVVCWSILTQGTVPALYGVDNAGSSNASDPLTVVLDTTPRGAVLAVSHQQAGASVQMGGASSFDLANGSVEVTAATGPDDISWTGATENSQKEFGTFATGASVLGAVSLSPF